MSKFRYLGAGLLACLMSTLAPTTSAQQAAKDYKSAAEVPVAQFFALEDFRSMKLSPDGKRIAAVAPYKGRGNLLIVDLATRQAKSITASERWDVVRPRSRVQPQVC